MDHRKEFWVMGAAIGFGGMSKEKTDWRAVKHCNLLKGKSSVNFFLLGKVIS